jgi:hypothetical protein
LIVAIITFKKEIKDQLSQINHASWEIFCI